MATKDILWILFLLIGGLILMVKSADYFVDSAVKIAELSRIPKLIIGATLVSLATSLPELFVSTSAVLAGHNDMAIGNALGSVIFNTAVILSLAAIFMSGKVDRKNVVEKSVVLIIAMTTLILFSLDLKITLFEASVQFLIVVVYTYLNIVAVKKQKEVREEYDIPNKGKQYLINFIILVISAVGIRYGAKFLVDGASIIATKLNITDTIVGLTILAIGTSLPELITTITAILKKQQSLSVGNILGANILNVTMIMGASGIMANTIRKGGLVIVPSQLIPFKSVPQTLYLDLPIAFIVIVIFVIPMMIKGQLQKWQGYLGLILYIIYITYLIINASIILG